MEHVGCYRDQIRDRAMSHLEFAGWKSRKQEPRLWKIVSKLVEPEVIITWVTNSKDSVSVLIRLRTYEGMVRPTIARMEKEV